MITNQAIPPLRQRRSATRMTAMALCLGLTAIGYGVARMAEPPLSSSYGALESAAEARAMNSGTQSRAADEPSRPPSDASCSGGSEGGADATGNQCNDPGSAISYTPDGAARAAGFEPVAVRLAAAVATCSGGAEGGMDATGNQCNP